MMIYHQLKERHMGYAKLSGSASSSPLQLQTWVYFCIHLLAFFNHLVFNAFVLHHAPLQPTNRYSSLTQVSAKTRWSCKVTFVCLLPDNAQEVATSPRLLRESVHSCYTHFCCWFFPLCNQNPYDFPYMCGNSLKERNWSLILSPVILICLKMSYVKLNVLTSVPWEQKWELYKYLLNEWIRANIKGQNHYLNV